MLSDVVVVELSEGVCGPMGSLLLAEMGATVIKVEPPSGDRARQFSPRMADGSSGLFAALNRNKKSLVLDIEAPGGREVLTALIQRADVLIRDHLAGGPDLVKRHDALIECVIAPFSVSGPLMDRPASELVIQAMAGLTQSLGAIGTEPVRFGPDAAETCTAVVAANGILASLFRRLIDGRGHTIEVSMLGTLVHLQGALWAAMGGPDEWFGSHCDAYTKPPEHGYATKDGRVYFNLYRGDEEQFLQLLLELGLEEMIVDPRFEDGGREAVGIGRYAYEVKDVWEGAFRGRTTAEVIEILLRNGAAAAEVNDYARFEEHPQARELALIAATPGADPVKVLRAPWHVEGFDLVDVQPAPRLGQDSISVLTSYAGYDSDSIERLRRSAAVPV